MLAIGCDDFLCVLEFSNRKNLQKDLERFKKSGDISIQEESCESIRSIEKELALYFEGKLQVFKTPLKTFGTPFQTDVWNALKEIPFGETRSYLDIAHAIEHPSAFRAVANSNGRNKIAIVIPCHRVINHNGKLGGYGGTLPRKQWLLEHEKHFAT